MNDLQLSGLPEAAASDEAAVFRPSPAFERIEFEDTTDVLLVRTATLDTCRLNPTADLVWRATDGSVSAGSLIDEIVDTFGDARELIAPDVLGVLHGLVAAGALVPANDEAHTDRDRTTDAILEPAGDDPSVAANLTSIAVTCTPCLARLDQLAWADRFTVAVGSRQVGVRVNRADVARAVRQLLADDLVDDPSAPPKLSLEIAPSPEGRGPVALHALHLDHTAVARSSDVGPVLDHLLTLLGAYRADDAGVVRLNAMAVVGAGGAVLLPVMYGATLLAVRRRLAERGITVLPGQALLDPETGDVVVTQPAAAASILARTLTQFGFEPAPDHPPMPVGKHPVVAWALDRMNEVDHPLTAIDAVFAGLPLVEQGRPIR